MITCREAVEKLWSYIDGELVSSEADAIRLHLQRCGSCHPHFDYQKSFCELLSQLARVNAPSELRKQVLECLLAEEKRRAQSEAGGSSETV
jgi:mycothiol system anti-sigma-R factor